MRAISYSICIVLAFVAISSFAEPDNTPLMPDISSTDSDTSAIPPDTSAIAPKTSAIPPDTSAIAPDTSAIPPDTSTTDSDTSTIPPATSTPGPDTSTTKPTICTKSLMISSVPQKGCMETTTKKCDEAKNMQHGSLLPNYCDSDGDCYKGRTCKDFFCTGDLKCAVACSDHLTRICDESKNNEGPYTCRTSADCFNGRVCFRCDYNCEDYEMGQQCNYPEIGQCGYYPSGEYGPCKIEW